MTPLAAPPESRARSLVSFFSGSLAATGLSMLATLLITRWTPPQQLGLWNFALLVSTYSSVLQLGVFNGLNRQLPLLQGRSEHDAAERASSAALAWCIGLTAASIAATTVVALVCVYLERTECLLTTVAIGTVVSSSWALQYLTVIYAASSQFGALARKNVFSAFLGLPMALFAYVSGFAGLLFRAGAMAVLNIAMLWHQRPARHMPRWQARQVWALMRIGFPIWTIGQLGALFMTLDRVVLADSPELLGFYSIAAQFAALSIMVPTAFNAVHYPHMAREYGVSHSAMAIWRQAGSVAIRSISCSLVLGLVCWVLIPPFVTQVLPAYVPGISAAQWAAFTGVAMALSSFGNIFNLLGRQDVYLASPTVGLMVFMASWHGLIDWVQQPKLLAAAQSMLFGTLAASITALALSLLVCRLHDQRHARARAPVLGAN